MKQYKTNNRQLNKNGGSLLVKILLVTIILTIVTQLYVLTSVGTQGEKVSTIKRQQEQIKIENEILKAKVLKLQSNNEVLEIATDRLQLETVDVIYIEPEVIEVSAQR